jgi:hypothetical protein
MEIIEKYKNLFQDEIYSPNHCLYDIFEFQTMCFPYHSYSFDNKLDDKYINSNLLKDKQKIIFSPITQEKITILSYDFNEIYLPLLKGNKYYGKNTLLSPKIYIVEKETEEFTQFLLERYSNIYTGLFTFILDSDDHLIMIDHQRFLKNFQIEYTDIKKYSIYHFHYYDGPTEKRTQLPCYFCWN